MAPTCVRLWLETGQKLRCIHLCRRGSSRRSQTCFQVSGRCALGTIAFGIAMLRILDLPGGLGFTQSGSQLFGYQCQRGGLALAAQGGTGSKQGGRGFSSKDRAGKSPGSSPSKAGVSKKRPHSASTQSVQPAETSERAADLGPRARLADLSPAGGAAPMAPVDGFLGALSSAVTGFVGWAAQGVGGIANAAANANVWRATQIAKPFIQRELGDGLELEEPLEKRYGFIRSEQAATVLLSIPARGASSSGLAEIEAAVVPGGQMELRKLKLNGREVDISLPSAVNSWQQWENLGRADAQALLAPAARVAALPAAGDRQEVIDVEGFAVKAKDRRA